ncbi:hypothetical protein GO003_006185 [Methylicorpusculum oleiharenae]|uniref:hypothetical protein n=1 Tax=Methylicorpusculum oleiharenae TaxID=1338687 RepID=UPI00135CC912|nr:hypothetical protein [Methylicorpusculum oleiharenae]MCD2449973.1 hypothetical protein [Methylicorpusculum oleiharenae]
MIEFEEGVSTPENWFRQSWQMFEASKSLYEVFSDREQIRSEKDNYRHVGAMKGAMLLLGFSAENALKGAFVYKAKPDTSKDRLDPTQFHDTAHDLTDVARRRNLELTDVQLELLDRLTIFVQWASKYQAPLRKSELQRASGKIKLMYPSDYTNVEKLISSLQIKSGFDETHGWPYKS